MKTITLKNLNSASAQEVFEYVATSLLKQRAKSEDKQGYCLYRCDGLRCAAGFLISDDEYLEDTMEKREWSTLVNKGVVPEKHAGMIGDLQAIHDSYAPANWKIKIKELGEIQELRTTFLRKL